MRRSFLLALAPLLLLARSADAALVDPAFTQTNYVYTASGVTGMAWAPDASNRLFVTLKTGQVRVVKNGALLTTPFSTDTVITSSECGLIGIAFDPAFASNGYVYLFETVSTTEQQIVRYTASGDVGTARTVIKGGLPTRGANHDGGAIGFGPDGMLYFAIGDLGNGTGVDADLTSLAAKIGRITPTGASPLDNPFYDGTGPNDDAIWARGHRNPFTFTFHPATERLWVNDVGTGYEKIFNVGRGDHAGYNDYEINQPTGYIRPTIHYRTNSSETQNIGATGASRMGNVATYTLTSSVRLHKGQRVTIAGVTNTSFNGTFYVRSIPTSNTFTVAQVGADATSGAGTVTTDNLGGSITGGVFYDGTQFPSTHRGNFFFGDFNSGNLVRATLASDQTANTVDTWGTGFSTFIDTDVGPDGALYAVSYGGQVYRIRYNATAQGLVLSTRNLRTREGGSTAFGASLAVAPTSNVTVTVARSSGDADVTAGTATLTFTPTNWNVPQAVTISAANDVDTSDDLAVFAVSSTGLTTENVTVRVTDDDGGVGLVTSVASLTINEGGNGTFTVRLSAPPTGAVTANIAASGDPDVTVMPATLSFNTTDWSTPKTVTVSAAHDTDITNDTATVGVTATGYPARSVGITVTDDDPAAPVITSTAVTTAVVDAPYTYDVNATGLPAPTYALTSTIAGMTINATSGIISWTPTMTGMFNVGVRAQNGVSPDATQMFTVTVAADAPPVAVVTKPVEGEIVSGTIAEFFGDGTDDVGTTKADFSIDGVVVYTDSTPGGHYHINGSHNLWDTTLLTDGPHKVRMTVYDTKGQTGFKEVNVTVSNGGDAGVDASADTAVVADATEETAPIDDTGAAADTALADTGTIAEPPPPGTDDAAGCGCRTTTRGTSAPYFALGALALLWRRRLRS